MRIAYLADPTTSNGFYRGVAPMRALAAMGHHITALPTDNPQSLAPQVTSSLDLLFVHRYFDEATLRVVRKAKEAGAAVVWDDDDDASAVERGSPAYRRVGGIDWERRLVTLRRILQTADLVTAPSAHLAQRLHGLGAAATAVIENHPPVQFLRVHPRRNESLVVGYVAGLEHQVDVERVPVRAALQRLLDERPHIRVHTLGLRLGLSSQRSTNVRYVPLLELTQHAAEFDVGIAPLADIPVNHARSNIKLKEYAAAGVPWLASPVGPYAAMGERQGGRVVADDRWYEELARLIDQPRVRQKLAKRGARWVERETLERNAHVWEQHLLEAVQRADATR